MNTYLIVLKLSADESLYTNVAKYLKSSSFWARPMPSVWIVKAGISEAQIRDGIRPLLYSGDGVLVVDITKKGWATSNLTGVVTDWMKKNV